MRFILFVLLVVVSCTQMKTMKKIDESQISPITRQKLNEARDLIKENKHKLAITKLSELHDDSLTPVEKSLKYNLKGVTLFNMGEVDKSLLNFEVSEKYAPRDTQLYSQVQLNMASGHYKLGQFNELKERLDKIDRKQLTNAEVKKYAQLALAYGNKVQNHLMIVTSSVLLLDEARSIAALQPTSIYQPLKESFSKLTQGQKIEFLEAFNDSKNLAVAHLAQIEADERYLAGDKSGAQDVIAWLNSEFSDNEEVQKFTKEFQLRLDNSSRISISDIGLVLPLSGEKGSFGQKALSGVDTGLKVLGLNENVKIHTKDSNDSPAQAAQAVLELIREKKVSFIIGGLFPESAKAEYMEARKYGVLYISLSQINLPKEEKNHHLIEVQGSIESQVEALLSEDMINKFGSRIGVIFPDNEGGRAYVDEIWRKATQKSLKVTSVASFPKNIHDYRDTAQLFLGLKYPRERVEELKILDNVYSQEKTAIRRVQTLPPVLDFDWVFLATYPHEATQLIPTLGYYDANRIKVVGGPSWVSKSLVKEQKNLGTLYFVGDDPEDLNQEMLTKFREIYGKPAGLIEILALDAMKLGADALHASGDEISGRDEFDAKVKGLGKLKGLSTEWEYKDGVWIKRMNAMAITRGEIVKLFNAEKLQ
ncbi:MAG: penicillin-binding protein activator [Bacteriovoracaceae bacterium]|nr:penicillin-binding protein activator [Bacteriovoracaceae bacterium]